ncbi:DUF1428 domain-containing protein [Alteromonas sp. ASW11-130]|uniref:DUF1428 domain-containing protein n=1 Tax=Alteromonas sp. ASW11-130 TaxID=3015775 RepID=UPI002241F297|nr:DUF1428 domain-containing protein [Alteromonas sp. ASW11-130]MCW8090835.1 DUF1428 domain-containing protein [Alteromonas sp. ASW11-130]
MDYVDGFVAAVPTDKKQDYIKHAKLAAQCFKECGAIRIIECWGDDVPEGKTTSFIKAVQCQADETVVFSWIVWPSREIRNIGMKKIMNDARMKSENNPMPFDGSRLIYGGFSVVLDI